MNSMGTMGSAPAVNWSMAPSPVRPMGMMQQQPMMNSSMMMMTSPTSMSMVPFNQPPQTQPTKQLTAAEMQDLLS